jgi:catechol 2,3-dioxygenase-like lactoylglutathione lyase family enzyme
MKPLDVHHVSVCVTDMAAARTFYVDVLGFEERTDRPDFGFPGGWFNVGGRQVHLIEVPEMPAGAGSIHFALRVDDIDAAVADIEAHGVAVHRSAHVPNAGQQAFLTDPSGNGIELNQPDH